MRILLINTVCGIKSTGRICTDIADVLESRGHIVRIAYGRGSVPKKYRTISHKIGNAFDVLVHCLKSRLLDNAGFNSRYVTKRFIEWIKRFDPDVIHLHNLHGYYINVKVLFDYLNKSNKRVIWTLHDCWPFTGHCVFFDFVNCSKWSNQCFKCKLKHEYPKRLLVDNSQKNYCLKRLCFTNLSNLVLVTPSVWLANIVKKSFFKKYKTKIINNGINIDVFKPRKESDVKTKYCLGDKKIVLGVASVWDKRKGLKDFVTLSNLLPNDYKIVLVGLRKKQIKKLPTNVVGIEHTNNSVELAELYSAAYVFVNLTYEDNYPTTNLEAISCGTPVLSYSTGGSVESAVIYGTVVEKGDVISIARLITGGTFFRSQRSVDLSAERTAREYYKLYIASK